MRSSYWLIPCFIWGLSFYACGGDDARAWQLVMEKPSIAAIDTFLGKYPNSSYKEAAIQRKQDFIWAIASADDTEYGYKKYLADYPKGKFSEQAQHRLDSLPVETIDYNSLLNKTFIGRIDYGNREVQILSMRFIRFQDTLTADGKAGARFLATINTSDIRKELTGHLDKSKNTLIFEEPTIGNVQLNLTQGRIYTRHDQIWIESVEISQFWRLK
jgi:hypothetical protein